MSMRRAILTIAFQLSQSLIIQQPGNMQDLMPFRDAVLSKPSRHGLTLQQLAQTGSEEELLVHFLIKPLTAAAAAFERARSAAKHGAAFDDGTAGSRAIIVSRPESIVSDAARESLLTVLLRRLESIPDMFTFVMVMRQPPSAGVEGIPGCRVVHLTGASPANRAGIEDLTAHVESRLAEHQRSCDEARISEFLSKHGAMPSAAELRKLAETIVQTKGGGNFQYATRMLRILSGRKAPIHPEKEAAALPDGETAALESLLAEKYLAGTGTGGDPKPTAEYLTIKPVLEVLAAAQSQLSRDELVEVLCLAEGRLGEPRAQ